MFFVSVASKEVNCMVSSLFSALTGHAVSVDYKGG
jgi:hypothetical protein